MAHERVLADRRAQIIDLTAWVVPRDDAAHRLALGIEQYASLGHSGNPDANDLISADLIAADLIAACRELGDDVADNRDQLVGIHVRFCPVVHPRRGTSGFGTDLTRCGDKKALDPRGAHVESDKRAPSHSVILAYARAARRPLGTSCRTRRV